METCPLRQPNLELELELRGFPEVTGVTGAFIVT